MLCVLELGADKGFWIEAFLDPSIVADDKLSPKGTPQWPYQDDLYVCLPREKPLLRLTAYSFLEEHK